MTIISLVVVETTFLVGLALPDQRYWTEPVAMIGMIAVIFGLIFSFWGKGIHTGWAVMTLVSLAALVWATETQAADVGMVDVTALTLHILAVFGLIVSFWLAIRNLCGPKIMVKEFTALSFGLYEVLTIVFLVLTEESDSRNWVFIALVASVTCMILGFWLMLVAVEENNP